MAQWQGASPFVQGPTTAATIRNAVQAASDQARLTAKTAADMGARARGVEYRMQNFEADYHNLQVQFHSLSSIMNALVGSVGQGNSPRAENAVAELAAGLNIIAEAFVPVEREFRAEHMNRETIVAMCQVLDESLREWDKELRKNSTRLGTIR
jgi:hypothetical protein